ncbi:MAG: amino acid-binding protein [Betaproteobacteria bacterium]|nr:amino acid-binding protein [Betaproteobacteria bacterium]
MAVSQISVFLENQPGHLKRVLDAFESVGVNVRGYSASDTGDYGIARFILDKPDVALDVLRERGCAATLAQVLCIRLLDKPGELARVMGVISGARINVLYSYSLISTIIAIHVDDTASAEEALRHQPIELVSQDEISETI